MGKFNEPFFRQWYSPPDEFEERHVSEVHHSVMQALWNHQELATLDIEVFVQGSCGNDTHVHQESDIDICIMLRSFFFADYPPGRIRNDYSHYPSQLSFQTFRLWCEEAIHNQFGPNGYESNNKSINIKSRLNEKGIDVIPALQYRDYQNDPYTLEENYTEGIRFLTKEGEIVTNFPKIHIHNGSLKNAQTSNKYKIVVRIMKKIKAMMSNHRAHLPKSISSFLISCLVWNIPPQLLNGPFTWEERVKKAMIFLHENTQNEDSCKHWCEVSEKTYLFHPEREWTIGEVNLFLKNMWNFLELK